MSTKALLIQAWLVLIAAVSLAIWTATAFRPATRLQKVGKDWTLYGVGHPECPIDTHRLDIAYDEREPNTLVISCTSRDKF